MPVTVPFDRSCLVPGDRRKRSFHTREPAEAVFYIRGGKIKLTAVSKHGKEAIVAILGKDA
jgi:hypothetical protein